MLLYLAFFIYFIILELAVIGLGINFVRIREKFQIHPRLICFIVPLIINYFVANKIFRDINPIVAVLMPCLVAFGISLKFEKVRIIGVTGGIATGKSTLTRLIRLNFKDIDIIDCDQIARNLRKKGQPGYSLLMKLLGDRAEQYLNPLTRQIQEEERKKLNEYVFKNPDFRRKLTREMGKFIMIKIFKRIISNILANRNVMIVDAPILYETKVLEYVCFPVALVGCSEEIQLERLTKRDGYTQEEAKSRIASQMPMSEKRKKTNLYLSNEGSEQELINEFSARIKRYLNDKVPGTFRAENIRDSTKHIRAHD